MYDPTDGYLLWDGVDIREFDPTELRHRIGAIFQDFLRFEMTAQENIALGNVAQLWDENNQALLDAVHRAASKAGIHDKIMSLPQGYHTILSRWLSKEEQGVDLSGGEWQKVALARMFMRNADLLILDEPTAALDAKAEYDLYNHFVELINGKTSLLISHRFSTVRMADVIAVLENGQISEYGSHEHLLSLGGTYSKLYNMQADRYK
jgi:ATP-binding cassette subfamily B protein